MIRKDLPRQVLSFMWKKQEMQKNSSNGVTFLGACGNILSVKLCHYAPRSGNVRKGTDMRYEIADLLVDMECSGRTKAQAEAYRVEPDGRQAHLRINIDPQRALERLPQLETTDLAEYMATGDVFAAGLLAHSGVMLHASCISYRGQAVCFSAPPGVGKSTHTEKWVRLFGAKILNDDKPALRRREEGWYAHGTPWSGKHDLSAKQSAPLKAICFLFRGEETVLEPLAPERALPLFMSQTVFRLTQENMDRLLPLADALLREVPVWKLTCSARDEAAYTVRDRLFPER